jgi:hypothetical protein
MPFLVVRPPRGRADEPEFSPDGKWLAYDSEESSRFEVSLIAFPPTGKRWQVSTSGGVQPNWRGDGKEIYFLSLQGDVMAVDVSLKNDGPQLGIPRVLFRSPTTPSGTSEQYVSSADGKRFLIAVPVQSEAPPLTVLMDWPRFLRR